MNKLLKSPYYNIVISEAVRVRPAERSLQERVIFGEVLDAFYTATPVTYLSPLVLRKQLDIMATYHRRELKLDFTLYRYDQGCDNKEHPYIGFLLPATNTIPESWVGGVMFRWVEWANAEPGWEMSWAWLHPYARRHGILTSYWPVFKRFFAPFTLDMPNKSMRAFLSKVEPEWETAYYVTKGLDTKPG
jgi:hypothetical protein